MSEIRNQMLKCLKDNGHSCGVIALVDTTKKLFWCFQETCNGTPCFERPTIDWSGPCLHPKPVPKLMKTLCALLSENDHACGRISGPADFWIHQWCNEEECEETRMLRDMRDRQTRQEIFLKELQLLGHRCVHVMESYPIQISWCKQTICTKEAEVDE